jgi:hypothetical protein
MEQLLNKTVKIIKDGEHIFTGVLKQSLSLECYVVIDSKDDNNRLVVPKEDSSFTIEKN